MEQKTFREKVFSKKIFHLNFKKRFLKIPQLLFNYIFKNPKIYLLNFFLPAILSFIIIFFWMESLEYNFYPPMFFNVLLINVLVNMVFLSFMMVDWKHSILLNRIKLNGFSKGEIFLGIYLVFFVVMLLSFLFSFLIFGIIFISPNPEPTSYFFVGVKEFLVLTFANLTFYNASLSAVVLILFILFSISWTILIPMLIEKKSLARTIIILIFLFAIGFAEIFMNSQFTSRLYWWNYLSYLSPWKYFSWYALYINSYATINIHGIDQIIDNIGKPYLSFSSIIIPSVMSNLFTLICLFLSFKFFKLATK